MFRLIINSIIFALISVTGYIAQAFYYDSLIETTTHSYVHVVILIAVTLFYYYKFNDFIALSHRAQLYITLMICPLLISVYSIIETVFSGMGFVSFYYFVPTLYAQLCGLVLIQLLEHDKCPLKLRKLKLELE